MNCINCKKSSFKKIIDLGNQPLSCKFPDSPFKSIKKYKLNLIKCNKCKLVQLDKHVDPNEMYGEEYGYFSSISPMMKKHLKNIVNNNFKYTKNNSFVLDIGSNDGTLLNYLHKKNKNLSLFGIDPNIRLFADKYHKSIKKIPKLFDKNIIQELNAYKGNFDLIFSIAMFYDVSSPNEFIKIIKKLLTKNGVWIVELSYFKLLIENMTFDQICHEHIAYYNLSDINKILNKHQLMVIDASINEINGGSIQVRISRKSSTHSVSKNTTNILFDEKKGNDINAFISRVYSSKKTLFEIIEKISESYTVYGYGASTKGNIILNFLNINKNHIQKICDANHFKYGRYTPGSKIKIISKEQMRKEKPDYLFVLIWSFRNEVIKQELEYIKSGGKLIIPYPSMHIIDRTNYKNYMNEKLEDFAYKK